MQVEFDKTEEFKETPGKKTYFKKTSIQKDKILSTVKNAGTKSHDITIKRNVLYTVLLLS